MNVYSCQSPLHVREIARCHNYENSNCLSLLMEISRLNDLVSFIEEEHPVINDKPIDFFGCGDWQTLIYELGGVRPNTRFMDDETCIMCDLTKQEIRSKYLENPTQMFPITKTIKHFPHELLSSLPLKKRRYCWMHGVNCILSNTCKLLYLQFPKYHRSKSKFKDQMKTLFSGWSLDLSFFNEIILY